MLTFDPPAARRVLTSGHPAYVFPYETYRQFRGDQDLADAVARTATRGAGRLFATDYFGMVRQHGANLPLCDQLVALAFLEPAIIKQTHRGRIAVQTDGAAFPGASQFASDPSSQLEVVTEIDAGLAQRTLLNLCNRLNDMGDGAAITSFMQSDIYRLDCDPLEVTCVH